MFRRALILVLAAAPMADRAHAAAPMTWQVEKRRDAETGLRSCHVRSLGDHVSAVLAEASPPASPAWSVRIGFDNRPGSLRYLRIGRSIHQTDAAAFRAAEAKAIVARLKAPGEFVFEWELGPGAVKQGGLFSTGDFAEKAALCENWIAGARAENVRSAPKVRRSEPARGISQSTTFALGLYDLLGLGGLRSPVSTLAIVRFRPLWDPRPPDRHLLSQAGCASVAWRRVPWETRRTIANDAANETGAIIPE